MKQPGITAVVTGAGLGTRMGAAPNKMLIEIDGSRVLYRTLLSLKEADVFDAFVVVVSEAIYEPVYNEVLPAVFGKNLSHVTICMGGTTRQDSVKSGLEHLPSGTEFVAVHDGARPFVTPEVVRRCADRLRKGDVDGVICVVPVKDTIKVLADDGSICHTPNRAQLFAAQTPQMFRREILMNAYEKAIWEEIPITDDAQMVEIFGGHVVTVPGDEVNIKITTPGDLFFGERILQERMETGNQKV